MNPWDEHWRADGHAVWCSGWHVGKFSLAAGDHEAAARARLAAAAPDMYRALVSVLETADGVSPELARAIDSALAKAKGP